ncbi:MAG: hypothetical protein L0H83_06795 [Salinisphaera sp.]|nr:hypothetical protein [Salinisphaera sp.]
MFSQTVAVTVDLLRLRRGPQDLPADWNLLAMLAGAYFIVTFAQVLVAAPTGVALLQALLATVVLAGYVRAVLGSRGRVARFAQTLAAMYAVGIVLTLLMLGPTATLAPFLTSLAQGTAQQSAAAAPTAPTLGMLAYMIIGVWGLVVFGHVYRHALDIGLGIGVLVALGFEVLLFLVSAFISPLL